jgi:apolipoprotein D and lipocalin family protein
VLRRSILGQYLHAVAATGDSDPSASPRLGRRRVEHDPYRSISEHMNNEGSGSSKSRKPPQDSPKPAPRRRRRTRAGDLDAWAEEIYAAPAEKRADADTGEAQVIVSTRLRKPKVHLTAPATATYVDLPRYMGRWYEIARLPYFTQRRCTGEVTADYVLGEDGMVYVTNRCAHKSGAGGSAKGVARVVDRGSNARFEISFRTLYGVHVLWDDYWIIGVGADYEYALVGQPTRKRAWVLAREPNPPEEQVQRWLAEFADKGFPAEEFLRTRQALGEPPP